jgi:formate dehydrogenase major subunit
MYEVSRRDFFKVLGLASAAGAVGAKSLPSTALAAEADTKEFRIKDANESSTICCFCSVGCSAIASTVDGKLINLEGDADSPINQGALCSKGAAQLNLVTVYDPETKKSIDNPRRVMKPRYRAPGATEWKEVEWDWAIKEIAARVKKTRDETFEAISNGVTVNRTQAIASLGCGSLPVEDLGPLQKLQRALGIVYIEHQARL